MAPKKPKTLGVSFAAVSLDTVAAPNTPPATVPGPAAPPPSQKTKPLKERSETTILYLAPGARQRLKIYAAEANRPIQDLLLEALEEWAQRRGIPGPFKP